MRSEHHEPMTLCTALKAAKPEGMSAKKWAEQLGVAPSVLTGWFGDDKRKFSRPGPDRYPLLMGILECGLDDLGSLIARAERPDLVGVRFARPERAVALARSTAPRARAAEPPAGEKR